MQTTRGPKIWQRKQTEMISDSHPVLCTNKVSIIVAFANLMESILTDLACVFDIPGYLILNRSFYAFVGLN